MYAWLGRVVGARIVVDIDDPIDVDLPVTSRCLRLADDVVIGHESLRATLPRASREIARVVATPIPTRIYLEQARPEGVPIVGWIGDGPSHAAVLQSLIRDAEHSAPLTRRRFRLRIVGAPRGDVPAALVGGSEVEVVESLSWADELQLASECAKFTVGLAPYRGRGGVAFKVIQYLAAGALPLVDRRSPGVDHLWALPEWLRAQCITDFSDAGVWGASLDGLLTLATNADQAELRLTLADAIADYDSAQFAVRLIAGA
jgi:hypothetical protein